MLQRRSLLPVALLLSSLLMLTVAGCPLLPQQTDDGGTGEAKLVPFASSQDLLNYFKQQANARYSLRNGWLGFAGGAESPAAMEDSQSTSNDEAASDGDYSTTNVQEVGVDESDVFKSDGAYFYVATGTSLRIVDAVPADGMDEVGRLDLAGARG